MLRNGKLQCDMTYACMAEVTHIDTNGWLLCAHHGAQQRAGGGRNCRRMRKWECERLKAGLTISYTPKPQAAYV